MSVRDLPEEPSFVRVRGSVVLALCVFFAPGLVSAFGLRWSASGGIGEPTEIRDYVGLSPRVATSLSVRFTDATYLGVLADYTSYQGTLTLTSGSHRRILAFVQWNMEQEWMPRWCHPFGQLGVGVGTMEYVGFTRVERLLGPASRLAAGMTFRLNRRVEITTILSFDRLDTAANQMGRFYPSMLSLNLEIGFHWPRGGPLLRPLSKTSVPKGREERTSHPNE